MDIDFKSRHEGKISHLFLIYKKKYSFNQECISRLVVAHERYAYMPFPVKKWDVRSASGAGLDDGAAANTAPTPSSPFMLRFIMLVSIW